MDSALNLILLVASAFFAGFVDSIAGGGGLIQLPALFVFLPPGLAANLPAVLGTNKFASICGTSVATVQYVAKVKLHWRILFPAALFAFILSFLGARAVTHLNPELIKPVILVLLVLVAVYTYTRRNVVPGRSLPLSPRYHLLVAISTGSVIGFYDGFFGPGTGSFLLIAFVGFFAFDFLRAAASAKVVNLSTNIAAILWFASSGNILYQYGIPMALANILGSFLGSRLAILKGSEFVRKFFLGVVLVLIARFAWELTKGSDGN